MEQNKTLGTVLRVIALILALFLVVGVVATLGHKKPARVPISNPYGTKVSVVRLDADPYFSGARWSAASYDGNTHIAAIYYPNESHNTSLVWSTDDGDNWQTLDLVQNGYIDVKKEVVDELCIFNDRWWMGFETWENDGYGVVYRFTKGGDIDNSWANSKNFNNHCGGSLVALKPIDGTLYALSSKGYFYDGSLYNSEALMSFAPGNVTLTDFTKVGSNFYVLGYDSNGTVLFESKDAFRTAPKIVRFDGVKANSFYADRTGVVLACDNGTIVRYTLSGTKQTAKMPEEGVSFSEVFTFGGNYYAIGSGNSVGVLYESANGSTWERVVYADHPLDAASVAKDEALVYGANGDIYRLTISK